MSVASVVILAVGAMALTIGVLRTARLVHGEFAPRIRSWVVRSSKDRRQRHVTVRAERRRGTRRQEEIASRFLSKIGKGTVIRRRRGPLATR
ncbi:MAG: hypothetical protein ACHQQS_08895 [Thermoanaerobaculales bacterium]